MHELETLTPFFLGGGEIKTRQGASVKLEIPARPSGYADAQLDDTQNLPRGAFRWSPPAYLSLKMRAHPSAPLGTLGFGFWNDPFAFSLGGSGAQRRLPAAPQAIWFFYGSEPNDLGFQPGIPGHGWKAMCLRSPRIPAPLLLPGTAIAAAFSRLPLLRGPLMRLALGQVTAAQSRLSIPLETWHSYEIHWEAEAVRFLVDGAPVLLAHAPPQVPLGFVTWIDNQYGIVSPAGGFGFGILPTHEPQWIEITDFSLRKS